MKKILKQVAGIDVGQRELVVCLGRVYEDLSTKLFAHKTFANTSAAFRSFPGWSNKTAQGMRPYDKNCLQETLNEVELQQL